MEWSTLHSHCHEIIISLLCLISILNKRPTGQLRQSNNICNMAFFPPKGINNIENFRGFQPKRLFFLSHSFCLLRAPIKKAQRKNLVQVKYKQDKPKVSTFEYTNWALGCDNHTVSGSVFSVSSYILVLRLQTGATDLQNLGIRQVEVSSLEINY